MAPDLPLIDVADIIRVVGGAAFQRGQGYARDGAVAELAWNAEDQVLTAKVRGNALLPYSCVLHLAAKGGTDHRLKDNSCSCPVGYDCKHVAAAALRSNTEHVLAREELAPKPSDRLPAWRRSLEELLAARTASQGGNRETVPLALQFELRLQDPAPGYRAAGRGTGGRTAHHLLGVRPVVRNAKGNWVKNNLAWRSIAYQVQGLSLDPAQHRWFSQFPALYRADGVTYFGQNDSWLYLDHFSNPLLWQLLAEAQRLGIAFVATRKDAAVVVGEEASLTLDVTSAAGSQDSGSPLQLSTLLEIDGRRWPTASAGVIGGHGIYTVEDTGTIALAPSRTPLTDADRGLLLQHAPVRIPAGEAQTFFDELFPRLSRALPVLSSDGSVEFPEIPPPVLVLTAGFEPGHRLALAWHWEYRQGGTVFRSSLDAGTTQRPGPDGDHGEALRDHPAEEQLAKAAAHVLGIEALKPQTVLLGLAAAEFADKALPELAKLEGVRVDSTGTRPDYRELTGAPELKISTVETEHRDWFDLGVMITVGSRTVPFQQVFKALSRGQGKLLLPDGSYLSLNRPEFDHLHRLIDEASSLPDQESGLRISRYQAGLWAELEDLAEETEQAEAWRKAVTGLLELEALPAPPPPAGLAATLRPYQLDGFNWLAFLWRHHLGGILADDMGLGKTLQTLALLCHRRENPVAGTGEAPFLVVAPTSVVPNWLSECRRFAPGLRVVGITDTSAKGGVPLAEAAAGADVVVTSYTLFRLDFPVYSGLVWDGLVLDEAQFIKNRATRVHQCARDLAAPFKLAITGTPMENNLMELWALFAVVAPGLFPSARRFIEEYQRPIERNGNNELLARLRRRMRPLLLRRTKEAVASDLPAKQEQVLEVQLGTRHRRVYETHLQRERQKLLGLIEDLDRHRMIVFRSLTLLRMLSLDASLIDEQYAGVPSAKLDVLFEQLEDVLAEGHRSLIFSQFTSFLKKAAARLDDLGIDYCYLDGSTRNRGEVLERFKNGSAPVFLISLKAGGFGLNLTEADYVFLLDPWWNPAAEAQAVDRTHRIGQTRNVMVYRLVAQGTIEEKVMALKNRKAELFSSVLDDDAAFSSRLTAEDVRALLE